MADDVAKEETSSINSDVKTSETTVDKKEPDIEEEKHQEIDSAIDKELESPVSSSDESSFKNVSSENGLNPSDLHYEDNICVYTEPVTKFQYAWDVAKNEWVPRTRTENKNKNGGNSESGTDLASIPDESKIPDARDSADSTTVSEKDYVFDGESYTYTDSKTGVTYKYDRAKNSWVIKNSELKVTSSKQSDSDEEEEEEDKVIRQDMTAGHYSYDGDTHLYTDPTDGTVYMWDKEKSAWFPKVDDDFLAHYQMNYGFTDPNPVPDKEEKKETDKVEEHPELKRKLPPKEPTWFEVDEHHNTKVYVSNLPLDITEQEFVDLMQKCGLVMRDVDSGKMKVKLYLDPETNQPKGDALCSYIKIESVELALKLLDGYEYRGHKVSVERARFQMKGDYNPNLKPKKRRKKDKEKVKKMQEKLFDWRPDKLRGERAKHERVVIVKNLFDPKIFDNDVALILEYRQDLQEECSKCGDVRKVVIYDRHAEGVAQVTFRDAEEADLCIKLLNGRFFGQRKITAETWDGKTKYKVVETKEEAELRLKKWSEYLEAEELRKAAEKADTAPPESMETKIVDNGDKEDSSVPAPKETKMVDSSDKGDTVLPEPVETKIDDSGGNGDTVVPEPVETKMVDSSDKRDKIVDSGAKADTAVPEPLETKIDDSSDKGDRVVPEPKGTKMDDSSDEEDTVVPELVDRIADSGDKGDIAAREPKQTATVNSSDEEEDSQTECEHIKGLESSLQVGNDDSKMQEEISSTSIEDMNVDGAEETVNKEGNE